MKIEVLKEIIKKDSSKEQFAILTNIKNGTSEIFELGKPLSKEFKNYKKDIENYHKLKKMVLLIKHKSLLTIILNQLK